MRHGRKRTKRVSVVRCVLAVECNEMLRYDGRIEVSVETCALRRKLEMFVTRVNVVLHNSV